MKMIVKVTGFPRASIFRERMRCAYSAQVEAVMEKKNDLVNQFPFRPFDQLGVHILCKQVGFRLAAMLLTLILLATLAVQPASAAGADLYVAKTGADTGNCLIDPCLTVAYAITQAGSGDRIHIAAGTYIENLALYKDLNFYGAGMDDTILDGGGLDTVLLGNSYNLVIDDMTIQNGHNTTGDGGGITHWGGTLTLSRVKVTGNTAKNGGGIISTGTLTMTDSVVSANTANDASGYGGGLFLSAPSGESVNLVNVTISGNTATYHSGGIHNQGSGSTLNLTNVTVSGNTAQVNGAMTSTNSAAVNILNNTIVDNHYSSGGANGGIGVFATINIKNTIISGNDGMNCYIDAGGSMVSLGYNLDSGSTCNFTQTGDLQNTYPILGPLADNGGPTQTHALLGATILHPPSPAIDAGTNTGCPATDQRGVPRPQGTHCDIGAFELRIYSIYLPLVSR
jgi:hypothetical protein